MSINALSWRELQAIIARKSISKTYEIRQPLFYGDWIDFEKYSSLVKVEVRRLKEGFLDQQGVEVDCSGESRIRYCRSCRRLGYHCTLFALGIVSHCPWHGLPLIDAREMLEDLEIFGGRNKISDSFEREREALDYPCYEIPDVKPPLWEMDLTLPGELERNIPAFCNRLIGWWATLKDVEPDAEHLLRPLVTCGRPTAVSEVEHIELLVGYAETLAPAPFPWRLGVSGLPSVAVLWEDNLSGPGGVSIDSANFFRHARKAVRRYICSRFVKPHRACLREISAMREAERLGLESGSMCSVCVAFLSWSRVYDVRYVPAIGRMAAGDETFTTAQQRTLMLSAHAQYANFLRIWADLEILQTRTNLYVCEPPAGEVTFDLPFHVLTRRGTAGSPHGRFSAKVIVPNASALALVTAQRCQIRRVSGRSMVNQAAVRMYDAWRWANGSQGELFKIKAYGSQPNVYRFLTV
jgi:hypothetical protein